MALDRFISEGFLRTSSRIQQQDGKSPLFFCAAKFISLFLVLLCALTTCVTMTAQNAATGGIHGTVSDSSGARIVGATVKLTKVGTGVVRTLKTDESGTFAVEQLQPDDYAIRADADGMSAHVYSKVHVDVGGTVELQFHLVVGSTSENVVVRDAAPMVETRSSEVAHVIDEKNIGELPLNGRRFEDLALLTPGVTQDPRGLTSSSTGDLSYGGARGVQNSMLVDGADNNNGFFAQARGRYRAPYQFSNEVVQEFRISTNAYSPELGRAGGAVMNVVTKSGTNQLHGSAFYYLRDSTFNAKHPFSDVKPTDRQQQFGFTLGGRIKRDKAFYFLGWDQHVFHVPTVVRFLNGQAVLVPAATDYEAIDSDLVQSAAATLNGMGGQYRSSMLGNAAFFKIDFNVTPRHAVTLRLNTSRYNGVNNVYLDPSSPITTYSVTDNGSEQVATESAVLSVTSGISNRTTNLVRLQFSRDLQNSQANSADTLTKIYDVIDGFGRSTILPRRTREHKLHATETISIDSSRQSWKFGGDVVQTWTSNYFPAMFGGEYIFGETRVNPWTWEPMTYGMHVSPLRAYAHQTPLYYLQDFGNAVSNPNTTEYSAFVQDTVRVSQHLAINFGLRYDFQHLTSDGLTRNPLIPEAGRLPEDNNNIAPRIGLAYTIGNAHPLVIRAGYGMFYTRIPSIYASSIATGNGITRTHLFLENKQNTDVTIFPAYPSPLVNCAPGATTCDLPETLAGKISSEISAFSPRFQTPMVQQASFTLEKEIGKNDAVSVSYLYTHGEHLIRARDTNLPAPTETSYPVFDDQNTFTGGYVDVASFGTWQMAKSLTCAFPPCVNDPVRPLPQFGAINVYDSVAGSTYQGLTVSMRRRISKGFSFRMGYTFAKALDDGADALVVGRPSTVENAFAPSERGRSVTDQRHRFNASWFVEPTPFHRDHPVLRFIFNGWKASGIVTIGSGRPVNAHIVGDANRDGNTSNDRLPGYSRNAFQGPDYASTDFRMTRLLYTNERVKLEFAAESFNLFNRDNKRVDVNDDGFSSGAGSFVQVEKSIGGKRYPAHYRKNSAFLLPNDAYAPRQVQFAIKMKF